MSTYWIPRDCLGRCGAPNVGDLVAYEYRPWRVVDIRSGVDHPDGSGRILTVLRLRPVDATVADGASRDVHRGSVYRSDLPRVLPEHYALCVRCGDLMPCREMVAEKSANQAMKVMSRYEVPGVCPACGDPVTSRMRSETFPNVVVPLGSDVTFHMGRRYCRVAAERYRVRCGELES